MRVWVILFIVMSPSLFMAKCDDLYSQTTRVSPSLIFQVQVDEAFQVRLSLINVSDKAQLVPAPIARILQRERIAHVFVPLDIKIQVESANSNILTRSHVDQDGWYTPLYLSSQASSSSKQVGTEIQSKEKRQVDFFAFTMLYGLGGFEPVATFPKDAKRFRLLLPNAEKNGGDLVTDWIGIEAKGER